MATTAGIVARDVTTDANGTLLLIDGTYHRVLAVAAGAHEGQADDGGAFKFLDAAGDDEVGLHEGGDVGHALGFVTADELGGGLVGEQGLQLIAADSAHALGG